MTIQKHILVVKSYVLKQILFFGVLCYSFSLSAQSITDIQSYIDSAETLKEIKPNEALEFGFKAKSLAENIGNENLVAESLQKIAIIHRILGNLEEAEDAINKALSYPINDYALISEMNNTKGVILKQMSQFDKALVCYSKTLKIQQYLNNKKGEARTYNNIGRIYEAMEQFDLAMFYYRKALKIYKTLDISKSTGITLQNIGHIYRAHNNLDSALVYFNLALPLYQRENN